MVPSLSVETARRVLFSPAPRGGSLAQTPQPPGPPALGPGLPRPAVLKQVGRPGGAGSPGGNLLVLVGPRVAAGPFVPRDASKCMEGLSLSVEQARLCPDPAVNPPPPWLLSGCGGPASAPPPDASRPPRAAQ